MNPYFERTFVVGAIIVMAIGAVMNVYWLPLVSLGILLVWVVALKPYKRITLSLEPFVDPNPRESIPSTDIKILLTQFQPDSGLAKQAIEDLVYIVNSFNTGRFTRSNHFAERVDEALKRTLVNESQLELRTQSVVKINTIKSIKVKPWSVAYFLHYHSFFQFIWGIHRKLGSQVVEIKTTADYYWLVEGEKSALPVEMSDGIRENDPITFMLRYELHNGQPLLVHFYDSTGGEMGEDVMQRA